MHEASMRENLKEGAAHDAVPDTNGIHTGVPAATHDIAKILKVANLVC